MKKTDQFSGDDLRQPFAHSELLASLTPDEKRYYLERSAGQLAKLQDQAVVLLNDYAATRQDSQAQRIELRFAVDSVTGAMTHVVSDLCRDCEGYLQDDRRGADALPLLDRIAADVPFDQLAEYWQDRRETAYHAVEDGKAAELSAQLRDSPHLDPETLAYAETQNDLAAAKDEREAERQATLERLAERYGREPSLDHDHDHER